MLKTFNQARSRCISILVVVLLLLVVSPALAGELKVTRVVDGDTIKVRGTAGEVTIRLVGIDAPELSHKKREPGQPYSQQATKHLAGLVLNKNVDIKEYGQDRYGRILGIVSLGSKNINLEMVEAGFAEVYRGDPAPGQDLAPYWKAEGQARAAKKGMWSLGDTYVSPREWRGK
jgi:micrococcal nuclease